MKKSGILLYWVFFCGIFSGMAQLSVLHNFNDTTGFSPYYCNLVFSNDVLFGMTTNGGNTGEGVVFSIHSDGSGFDTLHNFTESSGYAPFGSLTPSGSMLFGMTFQGGKDSNGCVFSIHTDGSVYQDILDFNFTNGKNPTGSLTQLNNTLYGMTANGGFHAGPEGSGYGVIFSVQTDGTHNSILLNFNDSNGAYPHGSLAIAGNLLFGMTYSGGVDSMGCVFSIFTDGSGYNKLLDFNGANGSNPSGSVIVADSLLFGMTQNGGTSGLGVVFSIHTDGSNYKDLFDFDSISGQNPSGDLLRMDSLLYGLTSQGGAVNAGVLFSIHTDGSSYKTLYDFNNTDGYNPNGSLTASGTNFYGMTQYGGNYSGGVIFDFSTITTSVKKIISPAEEAITIYPNPAFGQVQFLISCNKHTVAKLNVMDMLGNTFSTETLQLSTGNTVYGKDIRGLSGGSYFIQIVPEEGNTIQKILVVR